MKSLDEYREGAMGALLDEYERALNELVKLLDGLTQQEFEVIVDKETQNIHCRSIKSIINHVVNAGYGYNHYIQDRNGQDRKRKKVIITDVDEVGFEAKEMFVNVVDTAEALELEDFKAWQDFVFRAPWGVIYDIEQILEHAIVHILRHRRQIQKFLIQLQS